MKVHLLLVEVMLGPVEQVLQHGRKRSQNVIEVESRVSNKI